MQSVPVVVNKHNTARVALRRIDLSSRGVLPTVARHCVWSRNLENEEAKACYRAVKIQSRWVVTPRKQQQQQLPELHLVGLLYTYYTLHWQSAFHLLQTLYCWWQCSQHSEKFSYVEVRCASVRIRHSALPRVPPTLRKGIYMWVIPKYRSRSNISCTICFY